MALRHPPLLPWQIDRPHHVARLGRFALESGDAIEECEVCYVTHGTLSPLQDNVVLVCAAIGQTHHRLDFLIGPGKALDPARYFIVAIDAIGNGLTSSPSTSTAQPLDKFPRFTIRDMVATQHAVLARALGLRGVYAVTGASMGGMQALQWGVSHPGFLKNIVAMTPMARTAPWSVAVNETCRAALMADPGWNGTHFTAVPERGLAAWSGVLRMLANASPAALAGVAKDAAATRARFATMAKDTLAMGLDPLDWIYQSYAYDAHDVSAGGDLRLALARITARTLVIASPLDLYNPAADAAEAASMIADAQYVELNSVQGHQAATAGSPDDVAAIDRAIQAFFSRS